MAILIGSYADKTFGPFMMKTDFKQSYRLVVSEKGVGMQGETEEGVSYAIYEFLDSSDRIVRPANYLETNPGRGHTVVEKAGVRWAVVNLSGNLFMQAAYSPFHVADRVFAQLRDKADYVIVDIHAEATSEKVGMGWHLDGRALAVLGTHTHVPTADGRVLPGGTAFISDVGMTGARGGVIGVKKEQILERFLTQMPVKFETAVDDVWVMGCVIETGENGLASSFEQIMVPAEG